MSAPVETQPISRIWSLLCMAISLAIAFAMNATVAHGHGKPIFYGVFMTAFIAKIAQRSIFRAPVIIFLLCVATFHVALVFILPTDNRYPGGFLFPAGIIELIILYYLLQKTLQSLSSAEQLGG